MTNTTPPANKPEVSDKASAFNAKIKQTWGNLSDDDIKLYNTNRDQFFARLKEKQSISKEDGEKILLQIEKAYAAEKAAAVKAA